MRSAWRKAKNHGFVSHGPLSESGHGKDAYNALIDHCQLIGSSIENGGLMGLFGCEGEVDHRSLDDFISGACFRNWMLT